VREREKKREKERENASKIENAGAYLFPIFSVSDFSFNFLNGFPFSFNICLNSKTGKTNTTEVGIVGIYLNLKLWRNLKWSPNQILLLISQKCSKKSIILEKSIILNELKKYGKSFHKVIWCFTLDFPWNQLRKNS
jgi:hypothetical protein